MTYTKTATLPVSPDEAFALITEPERLRRWMTVSAYVDLRAGGDFRWTVTPGHHVAGTIREVEPGRRVVFGWGWEDDETLPADASTVTITIEPSAEGSLVTLEHADLPEALLAGHAEGWDHFLERLESVAATGDAGQDPWAWAPENLTPIVASEAALAVIQPILRNLTPADQPKPTPCTDLSCHQLVEHLMTSLVQLGGMAGGTVTRPDEGGAEHKVSVMAGQAIEAWRRVDLDGTVPHPGGEMPASFAAGILPVELLLHGWDIAQSTGQSLHVSDEVVSYIAELAQAIVPGGRGTSFADEVTVADDSSAMDRLAAFAGRVPMVAAEVAPMKPLKGSPEGLTPLVAAEAALAAVQPVLRLITADDADRPTPCPDLPVGPLVDHLVRSMVGLSAMVGVTVTEAEGSAEHRVSVAAGQAITAWRGTDLDSMVAGPVGEMPARVAATLLGAEIILHGWDLAQAFGRTLDVSDDVAAYLHRLSEPILPTARGRSFADEVPAPDGAAPLDRFAAFAGRTPMKVMSR